MRVDVVSLGGGKRVLLSDAKLDASSADIFEAILESNTDGTLPVVVKVESPGYAVGNRIESERRFYEAVRGSAALGLAIPHYFGSLKTNGRVGLVLERGWFPLDRVCTIDPGQDPILRDMIHRIAVITAARLVTTVDLLADISKRRARGRMFIAHRDIRVENILAVNRDGIVDIVLADWGHVLETPASPGSAQRSDLNVPGWTLAPEQRGPQNSKAQFGADTDLWAVGLALWRLLHRGQLPLRLTANGPRIAHNDPIMNDSNTEFVIDVNSCARDDACLMKHEPDDPIHRLVTELLTADGTVPGSRNRVATEAADGLLETLDLLMRDQATQPADPRTGSPLTDELVYANLLRGRSLLFPVTALPAQFFRALPSAVKRPSRPALTWVRVMFASFPRGVDRILSVVAGLLVGASAGWAATMLQQWQIMPLPDPSVDTLQGRIVGIGCGIAGLLLFAVRLAIRRRSGAGYRRAIDPYGILAAGIAAVGAVFLAHTILGIWPNLEVTTWQYIGAALLGGGVTSLLPLGHPAALRRKSRQRRGPRLESIVSALAAAILAGTIALVSVAPGSAAAMENHAIDTSVAKSIAGMPDGKPAFFDPYDMAVASNGDIAVVDEYATGEDEVWLLPKGSKTARDIFRTYPLANAPTAPNVTPLQKAAEKLAHPTNGPRVTTIAAIAFLGSDLVVIGSEGITKLDFSGSATVASRITSKVTVPRGSRLNGSMLTQGSTIYVEGAHSTIKTVPQSFCARMGYTSTQRSRVLQVSESGTVIPYAWSDSSVGACVYNVWGLAPFNGKVGIYGSEYINGGNTPYVSMLDGSDLHTFPQLKSKNPAFYNVAVAGDRVFAKINDCVVGFALSKSAQMPIIVSESTYTSPTDPDCSPDQPGFLGKVSASEFTWKVNESSCATPNAGTSVLISNGWAQDPVAVDAKGSFYTMSVAGPECTPTVWKLADHQTDWQPVRSVTTEPDYGRIESTENVTTMTATNPSVSSGVVHWDSPQFSFYLGDPSSSQYLPAAAYEILEPITQLDFGSVTVTLGTGYGSGVTTLGFASEGVVQNEGLQIPGATSIARSSTDQLLVARCDQLLSIDPTQVVLTAKGGELTTKLVRVKVIAGSDTSPQAACQQIKSTASNIHTGLIPADIAPLAVSSARTCATCDETYVLAESGSFDGQNVSRVTEINSKTKTIETVGYKPGSSDPSGNLAPFGLVPTDVSINRLGQIAVTTVSSTGYGPVLLFWNGKRSVVQLPSAIQEPSGVVWDGDKLVVTDAAIGNVVELSLRHP